MLHRHLCVLACIACTVLAASDPPISTMGEDYACTQPNALIRQIDHFPIGAVGSLEEIAAGFAMLHERLGLPSPWPWGNYSGIMKGAVAIGDVNIEFVKSGSEDFAMALAPCAIEDINVQAELQRRNIPVNVSGRSKKIPQNYTGFALREIAGPTGVFLCRYHFDESLRRAVLLRQQLLSGGGALGILSALEAHIEVGEMAFNTWTRLVAPRTFRCNNHATCRVAIGAGPDVVLNRIGSAAPYYNRVHLLIWAVTNTTKTEVVLREHGLLGNVPSSLRSQGCCSLSLSRFGIGMPAMLVFCPARAEHLQVGLSTESLVV